MQISFSRRDGNDLDADVQLDPMTVDEKEMDEVFMETSADHVTSPAPSVATAVSDAQPPDRTS